MSGIEESVKFPCPGPEAGRRHGPGVGRAQPGDQREQQLNFGRRRARCAAQEVVALLYLWLLTRYEWALQSNLANITKCR